MLIVPAGVKVHLALGYTGACHVGTGAAEEGPILGQLFAFRGKKASMLKILFWDGNGLCLFTKRIDLGRFGWGLLPPIVSQRHSPPAPPKANPTTTIQEDRIRS